MTVFVGAACAPRDAKYTLRVPSDFARRHHDVSILGVYKDGRMSSDEWEALRRYVAPALDATDCDMGYSGVAARNVPLANAIDDYARADGPTDDLLALLSPAARGDTIVVLAFAGRLPERYRPNVRAEATASSKAASSGARGSGRAGRRAGPGANAATSATARDSSVLDVSATFYSVVQARTVGSIAMQYSGYDINDAFAAFGARLKASLANARCVGWSWEANIDVDALRRSMEE